jgi:hypothetical protein
MKPPLEMVKAFNLAAEWASYRESVMDADAPALQVLETQMGFYAGASVMFKLMATIGEDEVPEEIGMEAISRVKAELASYLIRYLRSQAGEVAAATKARGGA